MIWPFSLFLGKRRQREQIAASLTRVVETSARQRQAASQENAYEATRAINAAETRIRQGAPIRQMLDEMIERQRDNGLAKDHR